MKRPSNLFWLILLLLAFSAIWFRGLDISSGKELVQWREDYPTAQSEAAKSGKPLLLYFTAQWCGPCQSLKSTVWADKKVAAQLDQFVPVKLDIDQPANASLAHRYDPSNNGIPFFVMLDKQQNVVRTGVGAVSPNQFLHWLEKGGMLGED